MSKRPKSHKGNCSKQQRKQQQKQNRKTQSQGKARSRQGKKATDSKKRAADSMKETVDSTKKAANSTKQAANSIKRGQVLGLEPLAPIIVRSGRPFDEQAGADPARFPPPSTIAGCLRTAWARQTSQPFGPDLARLAVAGPLLLREEAGSKSQILVPKPADALYFGTGEAVRMLRAEPSAFDDGCGADLPAGLLPVRLSEEVQEKPGQGPAWWSWDDLLDFRQGRNPDYDRILSNGWSPPLGDLRTHVAIDRRTQAADSGRLFQTQGLDLDPDCRWLRSDSDRLDAATVPVRLLVHSEEALSAGLVHLGGERRLAELRPKADAVWPEAPSGWFDLIERAGGLTLTLLTPGLFGAGFLPGWLDEDLIGRPPTASSGPRLQLLAVAVERWQPQSGWDLAANQPRATRKLVPAGATYWFRLLDREDGAGLSPLWLASLCDEPQDRLDGFGLALPVAWIPPDTTDSKIND